MYSLCLTLTLTNFIIRPAYNGHELPFELLRLTDVVAEADYLRANVIHRLTGSEYIVTVASMYDESMKKRDHHKIKDTYTELRYRYGHFYSLVGVVCTVVQLRARAWAMFQLHVPNLKRGR